MKKEKEKKNIEGKLRAMKIYDLHSFRWYIHACVFFSCNPDK